MKSTRAWMARRCAAFIDATAQPPDRQGLAAPGEKLLVRQPLLDRVRQDQGERLAVFVGDSRGVLDLEALDRGRLRDSLRSLTGSVSLTDNRSKSFNLYQVWATTRQRGHHEFV